jgi:pimeloyl-ACP methyl ester carboxylesterase
LTNNARVSPWPAPSGRALAQGYDVTAWDAPGCGGSADPAADLGLADYADAVAALVRALGSNQSTSRGTYSFQGGRSTHALADHE